MEGDCQRFEIECRGLGGGDGFLILGLLHHIVGDLEEEEVGTFVAANEWLVTIVAQAELTALSRLRQREAFERAWWGCRRCRLLCPR